MQTLCILYHDVIDNHDDESGFPGGASARYKLPRAEFDAHLNEMASRAPEPAVPAQDVIYGDVAANDNRALLITVDDGGSSSMTIADMLEAKGWRGTFFITTDFIDKEAFVTKAEIRDLHARGHLIGSHSCSHPYRISELPEPELRGEWQRSADALSDILGEPTKSASVPGGFYQPRAAKAAAEAGITALFTSEPTTAVENVHGCNIFGRYTVYGGMTAKQAGDLAAGNPIALTRQYATWNTKKALKTFARPVWEQARKVIHSR